MDWATLKALKTLFFLLKYFKYSRKGLLFTIQNIWDSESDKIYGTVTDYLVGTETFKNRENLSKTHLKV